MYIQKNKNQRKSHGSAYSSRSGPNSPKNSPIGQPSYPQASSPAHPSPLTPPPSSSRSKQSNCS